MVPGVIPLMLIFIPSIMMALGVVREKELGSIINLYVTPVTRLEFLLGKQLPSVAVSMVSYCGMVALSVFVFEVPLKGSFLLLTCAALLFVIVTTDIGLLISSFAKTQIAALALTAILTLLATVTFSGLTTPVLAIAAIGVVFFGLALALALLRRSLAQSRERGGRNRFTTDADARMAGRADHGKRIFALVMLELWLRRYFERPPFSPSSQCGRMDP